MTARMGIEIAARSTMASVTAFSPLIALIAESCSENTSEPMHRQAMPIRLLRAEEEVMKAVASSDSAVLGPLPLPKDRP